MQLLIKRKGKGFGRVEENKVRQQQCYMRPILMEMEINLLTS